jgi:hypothetical protein
MLAFRDFSLVAKEPDMQEASSRLALMENAALKPLLHIFLATD